MEFFLLIVAALACYRLTRFLVADKLFDRPRDAVHGWLLSRERFGGFFRWLQALISCGWCASVWFAGWITAVIDRYYSVPLPAFFALAVAALAVGYWNVTEPD